MPDASKQPVKPRLNESLTPTSNSHNSSSTPNFTPSETPPESDPHTPVSLQHNMEEDKAEGSTSAKAEISAEKSETAIPKTAEKVKDSPEAKAKKLACKKHSKNPKKLKRKPKKQAGSSSESSSSDSSSSSSESEDPDSESEEEEDSEEIRKAKRKIRARKAKKNLKSKKAKSKKGRESSSEDSDCDSDESFSEEEERKPKKSKSKKSKKKRKEIELLDSDSDESGDVGRARAQLNALGLGRRRRIAGRRSIRDRDTTTAKKSKGKGKKKKRRVSLLFRASRESKLIPRRGSKVAFIRVDQLWDSSIHNYKLTETAEDADADEYDQYVFTVRRKFDWENKYTDTVIDIKSKPLKDALTHVMGAVKGVSFAEDTPVIDPNMLFLYLEEIRTHMKELKSKAKTEKKKKVKATAKTKAAHVKVLVKYLDKDYAETKKTLYPLLEANTITFDLLWALFKSNDIAYCPTYSNPDEPRAFKIEYANKESSFMKGQWYSIEGRYLEYDGKSFGMGTMSVEVEQFKGPRKISSLACYPLRYHKDCDKMKQHLIERGKKFVALKGMNYRFHKGMGFYKKKRQIVKVNINGRVMVDPAIHRRINPNYPISTVKPKDPDIIDDSDESDDESCGCACDSSDGDDHHQVEQLDDADEPRTKMKLVVDEEEHAHLVEVEVDENGNEIKKENLDTIEVADDAEHEFSEEELLIASPVVLGFAFSEKLWLEFTVSGITEIEWNEGAFSSLVLPDNQKSIVKALVESHTFQASRNIDDVIQGKGRGLVAVLHGPPGTGKTLTAEGIAELLKCPLYMVSAGELGTNPRELEAELNKILDIAHSWGAVLLLDEADVFLEKRTIQDIHRNALVSIFLRLLEYFQGILFLTTNRVETFDDAFQSRIHVALRYGELTTKAKRSVWKMFLDKVREKDGLETIEFSEDDYRGLSKHNLNGRQIKNAVRTAQALAVNEREKLGMEHIRRVLDVAETFEKDLKGGTGYEGTCYNLIFLPFLLLLLWSGFANVTIFIYRRDEELYIGCLLSSFRIHGVEVLKPRNEHYFLDPGKSDLYSFGIGQYRLFLCPDSCCTNTLPLRLANHTHQT